MFRCTRVPTYTRVYIHPRTYVTSFFLAFVLLSLRQVTIIKKNQRKNEKKKKDDDLYVKFRLSYCRISQSLPLSVIFGYDCVYIYCHCIFFFFFSYLGLMCVCVFFLLFSLFIPRCRTKRRRKRKQLSC